MSYAVGGISILIALFAAWYWWPDRPESGQTCRYTVNFKFDYPKFTDCLIDCNPNLYCIMDIEGVGRYLMPVYTQN